MCLAHSPEETRRFKETHKNDKWITVYKIVRIEGKKLKSIWYNKKWRKNWNHSERQSTKLTKIEKLSNRINYGFHVYTNKPAQGTNDGRAILPLLTKLKYLVSYNNGVAVFSKLKLTKENRKLARSPSA